MLLPLRSAPTQTTTSVLARTCPSCNTRCPTSPSNCSRGFPPEPCTWSQFSSCHMGSPCTSIRRLGQLHLPPFVTSWATSAISPCTLRVPEEFLRARHARALHLEDGARTPVLASGWCLLVLFQ